LEEDRQKTWQIQSVERKLAAIQVHTPYILLLSHCGVNVVLMRNLAGEMSPIAHYAQAKAIK
jgi:hypothetical protein